MATLPFSGLFKNGSNGVTEPQSSTRLLTEEELNQKIAENEAMQEMYGTGLYGRIQSVVDEITMNSLVRIFSQAEAGYLGEMIEFYQRMEASDARLRSIIRNRRLASTRNPYNIQLPTEAEDNAQAMEAKELVEQNLERMNWNNTVQDLLDGRLYGVAMFEKIWRKSALTGKLFIDKIQQIEPYRIEQYMQTKNRLEDEKDFDYGKLKLVSSLRDKKFIEEVPPYKLVVAVNTSKKGHYDLAGELRPVARWYVIKTFVAKMWAQFAEKYGFPFVSVKLDKSNFEKHKSTIKKFIESAGANRYLIAYDFMEYDIHQARTTASVDVFERLMNMCNLEMTIGVLGQSLTTDVGDSGSRALGDVHKEVKDEISEDDSNWIDELVNMQIVNDIVKYNFPDLPHELYPKYQTVIQRNVNLREWSEGVRAFSKLVPVSTEWIYEESQVPRPDEDEEQIGGFQEGDSLMNTLERMEDE